MVRRLSPHKMCLRWGDCEGADFYHRVRDARELSSNAVYTACRARGLCVDDSLDVAAWAAVERAILRVEQVLRRKTEAKFHRETLQRFYLLREKPSVFDETRIYRLWSVVRTVRVLDAGEL